MGQRLESKIAGRTLLLGGPPDTIRQPVTIGENQQWFSSSTEFLANHAAAEP